MISPFQDEPEAIRDVVGDLSLPAGIGACNKPYKRLETKNFVYQGFAGIEKYERESLQRKVGTSMAQYVTQTGQDRTETVVSTVANPIPVGLSALAFTTAIIGCTYAGFIIPSIRVGTSLAVGAALFYGILAGMWEFKENNTIAATITGCMSERRRKRRKI